VIGGEDNSGSSLKSTYSYDPASNQWTKMADMIEAREDLAAAVYNNQIVVCGGYDGKNDRSLSSCE